MDIYKELISSLKKLHQIHIMENDKLNSLIEACEQNSNVPLLVVRQLKNFVLSEEEKSNFLMMSISQLEHRSFLEGTDKTQRERNDSVRYTSKKLEDKIASYSENLRRHKALLQKYLDSCDLS